jgi:hypothetical protein
MDPSWGGLWPEETNSETTFPREMQVRQPSPQKPYCYCASLMPRTKNMLLSHIPNTFIQMQVDDEEDMAIIKICAILVDILVQIAPNIYKSYVMTDKKGMKQLLVQCQNALYGTMVASLLYYCKFTKSPTSVGFKINP